MPEWLKNLDRAIQAAWNVEYMDWQAAGGCAAFRDESFDQREYRFERSMNGLPNRAEPLRNGLIGRAARFFA